VIYHELIAKFNAITICFESFQNILIFEILCLFYFMIA